MKTFRTEVMPVNPGFKIAHKHKIVSIGSCFSENIGKKFSEAKFNIHINPFGQQYNPHSISNALNRLLHPTPYSENELVERNGLYQSFDHHGSFSGNDKNETLHIINESLASASSALIEADVLFLTFGTSYLFSLKENNRIVSNCHKFPMHFFNHRMMKPTEIIDALEKPLNELKSINHKIKIVLTVSPVRYFTFSQYENSVGKGHLFTAIYELQQRYPDLYYFPAYELIMDDLRDYRFYKEDMIHPNDDAIEYVWDAIRETFMDRTLTELIKRIDEIRASAFHRPRNPGTDLHKMFVALTLSKIAKLKKEYGLSFDEEEQLLSKNL